MEYVPAPIHHVAVSGVVDDHRVEARHVDRRLPRRRHRQQERLLDQALEIRPDHPDRLPAVIERRVELGPLGGEIRCQPLHLRPGRDEHRDAAIFLHQPAHHPFVEVFAHVFGHHVHSGPERRIEGTGLEDVIALEIGRVEGRIHRGAEPDEPAPGPLAQGQAQLELRRGLVDFVDDDRVPRRDQIILEPPPRNPRRHDHDVPRGRLRSRLALPVHHSIPERLLQQRLRDHPGRERLPRARPRHDPEALPRLGPRYQFGAVLPKQHRFDLGPERQFDRFAGGAGGGDDDDPPARMPRGPIGGRIDGKVMVSGRMHPATARPRPPSRSPLPGSTAAPPCPPPTGRASPSRRTPPPSDRKIR